MKLPNLDEARKRNNNEIEFITLDQNYDENSFKNKKYFLRTYGCQMNVHDGEEIAARLETLGFKPTEILEESDIVILNTCAIRENAHDKLYGFLGRCKHEKENNWNMWMYGSRRKCSRRANEKTSICRYSIWNTQYS